jgi:acetoacetyl-CoA reductase
MSRVALVTGGTRGIGAAIAVALKNKGYQVIANYHTNHDAAKAFGKEHNITVQSWDVSDANACKENVKAIQDKMGIIEILAHNAGITRDSFLHKMPLDHWQQVIQTNLNSCFYMGQAVIESMRQNNFGRIVFTSSVNALKGQMGQTNYCAAKAGIIGFAKALALETANKNITVNVIAPGYVNTEMVQVIAQPILEKIVSQIPKGRLAEAHEIAHAVSFLVSDEAGYITGETLNVNGGLYLS